MLLLYEEGLRVVIHTANLISADWHQKTQGYDELLHSCCQWVAHVDQQVTNGKLTTLGRKPMKDRETRPCSGVWVCPRQAFPF